ncbi:MAG: CRISPR-associated endoribonuclease Cas6 [Melioribacteraceae bacterium]|nr:CRISPR-associated endoribonuclease Cas6 [Melioribacteraceae bacterium]MCF8396207.1 CRISPR-associated endoribonuclease Cas6 [Melioribacteraceae bacterium]
MRLKLTLNSSDKFLPVNYNYYLAAAIYKLLNFGSPEFAEFLHNKGFVLNGKPYKLFCFALRFKNIRIVDNFIRMIEPHAALYISSPLIEDFIQNFIIGTFNNNTVELAGNNFKCNFLINQVESLPEPEFNKTCNFQLLSPVVLSTLKIKENGKPHQYYFRYNDDITEINRVFNQNLKNKYELIYNNKYEGEKLVLQWDKNYIKQREKKKKRLTKKITIEKYDGNPIDIIANELPFTLTGSPELMHVGYQCGFGEKNSMGFGLADTDY